MSRDEGTRGVFHRLFERVEHDTAASDAHWESAQESTLDLGDIQGLILRGYRMPMVRHFLLTVGVAAEARKMLGRLVSGDEADAPQITTAQEWQVEFALRETTQTIPASQARLLPERRHYLVRSRRIGSKGSGSGAVV